MKSKVIETRSIKDLESEINSALASIGSDKIRFISQTTKQNMVITTILYEE